MPNPNQIVRIIELGVAQVNINSRDQGLALAALAQEVGRRRVTDAAVAGVTGGDGAADPVFTLGAVRTPDEGTVDGATAFADKAGFDARITALQDAHETLRGPINDLLAALQGDAGRRVAPTAGTAGAGGAIGAIGGDLAGATADVVDAPTAVQQLTLARNNQASLAAALNFSRIAVGLRPFRDGTGGMFTKSITIYPMADQDATGPGLTGAGTTLDLDSTNRAIASLRDNVSSLAAALNETVGGGDGIGPFVIATHNPHTRFVVGDTTP